ncbi:MAG: signal peptidase II [Gammaproteobacteria bacterium]|nr:signal peptidase II [Gammaproteobacteria bacterium]
MSSELKEWNSQNAKWLLCSIGVVILDQLIKLIVRKTLIPYLPLKILPWLNFTLSFNSGTAFGFLNSQGAWAKWALIAFAVLIIGYLLIWIFQTEPFKNNLLCALTLILGGAVSNLIDRFWAGRVTDFISFHINTWYFATFNIADAAISVGACILVILLLLKRD